MVLWPVRVAGLWCERFILVCFACWLLHISSKALAFWWHHLPLQTCVGCRFLCTPYKFGVLGFDVLWEGFWSTRRTGRTATMSNKPIKLMYSKNNSQSRQAAAAKGVGNHHSLPCRTCPEMRAGNARTMFVVTSRDWLTAGMYACGVLGQCRSMQLEAHYQIQTTDSPLSIPHLNCAIQWKLVWVFTSPSFHLSLILPADKQVVGAMCRRRKTSQCQTTCCFVMRCCGPIWFAVIKLVELDLHAFGLIDSTPLQCLWGFRCQSCVNLTITSHWPLSDKRIDLANNFTLCDFLILHWKQSLLVAEFWWGLAPSTHPWSPLSSAPYWKPLATCAYKREMMCNYHSETNNKTEWAQAYIASSEVQAQPTWSAVPFSCSLSKVVWLEYFQGSQPLCVHLFVCCEVPHLRALFLWSGSYAR